MRLFIAIFVGKTIAFITRFLNIGGGSAAPGLYALKVDPNLVSKLASKVSYANVVITGTNGKTTAAKLLSHLAKAHRFKVIHNSTGSNLERGIASTLIKNYDLLDSFKKPAYKQQGIAIWELDEAAFNSVAPKLDPEVIVFLNIFRDQMDRYGEVDIVIKRWSETLKKLDKETIIFANGDDANITKLKTSFPGQMGFFGLEDHKIRGESINHKTTQKLDFTVGNIKLNGLDGSTFNLKAYEEQQKINLPLPGFYNIYNLLAAVAVGTCFEFKSDKTRDSLNNFSSAFGRAEKLPFGSIFLIKNPTGATQVFETLVSQIKSNDRLLLALNDNLADGTDVSWIWDAEFEKLEIRNLKLEIICSGTRANELAVRLKYAGFKASQITVEPSLVSALEGGRTGLQGSLYILPTYTAMLAIQRILAKMGIKKEYWRET